MQINCKQCGAQVPAEHINLDRLIAKCTSCHSVFSFADQQEIERFLEIKDRPVRGELGR